MTDAISELKIRARILQRGQAVPTQLKVCLSTVSRELGFAGWRHACRVLRGEITDEGFGDVLYPRGGSAYLNHWFARHDEARSFRAERGGHLLAYRKQFFVTGPDFIAHLGLDPDDAEWARLGWDWGCAGQEAARARLYDRLLGARGCMVTP